MWFPLAVASVDVDLFVHSVDHIGESVAVVIQELDGGVVELSARAAFVGDYQGLGKIVFVLLKTSFERELIEVKEMSVARSVDDIRLAVDIDVDEIGLSVFKVDA